MAAGAGADTRGSHHTHDDVTRGPLLHNFINGSPHALCLRNTLCEATKDIRDSLDSLGGVKVLLPLIKRLTEARAGAGDTAPRPHV